MAGPSAPPPATFAGGHVVVNSTLDGNAAPSDLGTIDAVDHAVQVQAESSQMPGDSFSTAAGMSVDLHLGYLGTGTIANFHDLDRQLGHVSLKSPNTVTTVLNSPMLDQLPAGMLSGRFALSLTPGGQGDGHHGWVWSGGVDVSEVVAANVSGSASAFANVRSLAGDALSFKSEAAGLYQQVQSTMKGIQDSVDQLEKLAKGLNANNLLTTYKAAEPLLARLQNQLRTADGLMAQAQGVIGQAQNLLARAGNNPYSFGFDFAERGAVEGTLGATRTVAKTPVGEVAIGLAGQVVVPTPDPGGITPKFVRNLRMSDSSMIRVSAVINVNGQNLSDFSGVLNDANALLGQAQKLVNPIAQNANTLLDKAAAEQAANSAAAIAGQARALSAQANQLVGGFTENVNTGLKISEAVGPGGGLQRAGVMLTGKEGHFDHRVEVAANNILAFLPGYVTVDQITANGGTPTPQASSITIRNVYHDFYPVGMNADFRLGYRSSGNLRHELEVGATVAAGDTAVGNLAVKEYRGKGYFGIGGIEPNLRQPGALPPMGSFFSGYDGKHVHVRASFNVNPGIRPNQAEGIGIDARLGYGW